jgi:arginine decarboxylase
MWTIDDSMKLYRVESWGNGYFSINEKGNLRIMPNKRETLDLMDIIGHIESEGLQFPILFRFPQILENRLFEINQAFLSSIAKFDYGGEYRFVFPLKVNQRREMAEHIVRSGRELNTGIEVGTKAELLAALTLGLEPGAMLICNGYKDEEYLKLALSAHRCYNIFIVINLFDEIHDLLRYSKEMGVRPKLGLRAKLASKGSGRWAESGGDSSKFGLSAFEMIQAMGILSKNDMLSQLKMLHFHIGSQITEIRRIKSAVNEAARIYSNIRKMTEVEYLNIGGGLSVDYNGSKTSSEASADYSLKEYADDVVYTLKKICDEEGVVAPTIVSESGRAVAAYHSFLVFKVIGIKNSTDGPILPLQKGDPIQIRDLHSAFYKMNAENYTEYYHNALQERDDLLQAFNLGYVSLGQWARGERLFQMVCRKAAIFSLKTDCATEESEDLKKLLGKKYICNFSLFQSVPDMWGIGQPFPVLPVHRLAEMPTEIGTIADITCDSDGEIKRFFSDKEYIELHRLVDADDYYLGVFLLGAYQDTLGDFHNLLGTVNEVQVVVNGDGSYSRRTGQGDTCGDLLNIFKYDTEKYIREISSNPGSDNPGHATDYDQMVEIMYKTLQEYAYFKTVPRNGSKSN